MTGTRRPGSHIPPRRTIELGSYIKPELGELQVGLAHFANARVARPFETFFGHNTVLRSRFHGNAPIRRQLANHIGVESCACFVQ